jgi:hypothetical protein
MHYAVEVANSILSLGCSPDDREIGVLFPAQEDACTSTAPRSTVDIRVSYPVENDNLSFAGKAAGIYDFY